MYVPVGGDYYMLFYYKCSLCVRIFRWLNQYLESDILEDAISYHTIDGAMATPPGERKNIKKMESKQPSFSDVPMYKPAPEVRLCVC